MTALTTLFECDGTSVGALTVVKASNQEYRTVLQAPDRAEPLHDVRTFWRQLRRPDLLEAMSRELGMLEALAEDVGRYRRTGASNGVHLLFSEAAHDWAAEHHGPIKDACKALGITLHGLDR